MFKALLELNKRVAPVLCSEPKLLPKFKIPDTCIPLPKDRASLTHHCVSKNNELVIYKQDKCGLQHDPMYPPLL